MDRSALSRRQFLVSGAAATAACLAHPCFSAEETGPLTIAAPFHGAVLNHRHGQQTPEGLRIQVSGQAPADAPVTVNGIRARRNGAKYSADVLLSLPQTEIVASSNGKSGRHEKRIRVVWDRNSCPRYRFSIDDNSFFLRDIAEKKYPSLFDCFYLKALRQLHEKYGAKFVLNIYYATADGFTLPQFPDRYKPEWRDQAPWLRLAFHAYANDPDRPYQNAPPEKLIADLDQVAEQIRRFAGEEIYSPPTVIHWGMVQPSAYKPLARRGARALSGYFRLSGGKYDVNYLMDDERSRYLSEHDALMDFESGIVFSRVDIVCNNTPIDQIVPTLAPLATDPNQAEIMDLFTHEQYFWPFYRNYVPDHVERLDRAIRWVTDRGYKPVFFHEGFLGIPG